MHGPKKSLVGNDSATERRRQRKTADAAKSVAGLSPPSQALVFTGLKTRPDTAKAMKLFEKQVGDEAVYAAIGQRIVKTFRELGVIGGKLTEGTVAERNTARSLQRSLLAALVRIDEDGPAGVAIKDMLAKLAVSKATWTNAHTRRENWLRDEKRKVRSDSKRDCPELAKYVRACWARKCQASPVSKHVGRKKPGTMEDRKEVHDLFLVTFGHNDVWLDMHDDENVQSRLREIGREHKIKALERGEGVGMNLVRDLRPWWCVTLRLEDLENCIDRYEVEFDKVLAVARLFRKDQGHGTTKCQCKCTSCRPLDSSGAVPDCCALQQFPSKPEFIKKCRCAPVRVEIVPGEVAGHFCQLKCMRNIGECGTCGNGALRAQSFPLCDNERNGAMEREFLSYRKVTKKVRVTKKKARELDAARQAAAAAAASASLAAANASDAATATPVSGSTQDSDEDEFPDVDVSDSDEEDEEEEGEGMTVETAEVLRKLQMPALRERLKLLGLKTSGKIYRRGRVCHLVYPVNDTGWSQDLMTGSSTAR